MNMIFLYVIFVLNLIGFLVMGYDKILARFNRWRISERALFFIAIIGGAFGTYLGMKVFHHKTNHRSFVFGIPILVIVNIALFFMLYRHFVNPVIID